MGRVARARTGLDRLKRGREEGIRGPPTGTAASSGFATKGSRKWATSWRAERRVFLRREKS